MFDVRGSIGKTVWLVGVVAGASIDSRAAADPLRHEAVVDAPVAEVWKAFTTKEGVESWMVAHGEVDLRVGGRMRTHYDPQGVLGDPNTIENTILSFEPMRMLSIKATKAPENFPHKDAIQRMWSVIYLDELGPQRTRVTCVGMGYGEDEASKKLREHFDKGNAWTMDKLRERFPAKPATDQLEETEQKIRGLVGGEWTFETKAPDGTIFRGRMTAESIMEGKFVMYRTWLGNAEKLSPHGQGVYGRDPAGGGLRVWDFGEKGQVSGGPVTLKDGNRLVHDWSVPGSGGPVKRYYIEDRLEDANSLRGMIYELKPGDKPGEKPAGREPMVNVLWKRSEGLASTTGAGLLAAALSGEPEVRVSAKRIDKEAMIAAPLNQVWDAWTTAEGVKTFFAQDARVELRVGGAYEMYFGKEAPAGSRGSEGCHVLSFLPTEMFAFSWNAPPQWPELRKERTSVVLRFEDLGDKGVRVKLTHSGFGEGPDWDAVHQYFQNAWGVVLDRLGKRFAQGPIDWNARTQVVSTPANDR